MAQNTVAFGLGVGVSVSRRIIMMLPQTPQIGVPGVSSTFMVHIPGRPGSAGIGPGALGGKPPVTPDGGCGPGAPCGAPRGGGGPPCGPGGSVLTIAFTCCAFCIPNICNCCAATSGGMPISTSVLIAFANDSCALERVSPALASSFLSNGGGGGGGGRGVAVSACIACSA